MPATNTLLQLVNRDHQRFDPSTEEKPSVQSWKEANRVERNWSPFDMLKTPPKMTDPNPATINFELKAPPSESWLETGMAYQLFSLNETENVFYLRMKGQNGKCASVQDTLKVLLNYAYGTEACPYPAYYFTFDSNTGYCSGDLRQQYKRVKDNYFSNYASYTQGVYRNFTLLVMSRGMASRALKVSCPFENSTSVTFNGQWHCYTQFPVSTPSAGYITNDVCSSWIPGGSLINFVHSAEPGLLAMKNGPVSYIGYLPSGVVPNSYAYRFANGSQIIPNNETLPWSANAPLKRSLVYWSVALELLDYNETRMNVLMCRNNAANPS
ncbi:hypothetical protein M3Y97_00007500 [Aphelenchoides bicaudatus]|nr:hypothetical protein M3Y97_00007500 [Aphelenchoides bicaudatus]